MESKNPNAIVLDYILNSVVKAAKKADILIWLEAGTLLGMVREDDYIPWECDLDFGVYNNDKDKLNDLILFLRKNGLNVISYTSFIHVGFPDSKCEADINIYKKGDDYSIVELYGPGTSLLAKFFRYMIRILEGKVIEDNSYILTIRSKIRVVLTKLFSFFPNYISNILSMPIKKVYKKFLIRDVSWRIPNSLLSSFYEVTFRGTRVFISKMKEEYLSYRYGSDWKIPNRNYTHLVDDNSILNKTVRQLNGG